MGNLQMLEMMLRAQNPKLYNEYISYKNSGKRPEDVINELISTGRINQDMLQRAKNIANTENSLGNANSYKGPVF